METKRKVLYNQDWCWHFDGEKWMLAEDIFWTRKQKFYRIYQHRKWFYYSNSLEIFTSGLQDEEKADASFKKWARSLTENTIKELTTMELDYSLKHLTYTPLSFYIKSKTDTKTVWTPVGRAIGSAAAKKRQFIHPEWDSREHYLFYYHVKRNLPSALYCQYTGSMLCEAENPELLTYMGMNLLKRMTEAELLGKIMYEVRKDGQSPTTPYPPDTQPYKHLMRKKDKYNIYLTLARDRKSVV
jgi:hypothetical protein